MTCIAYRDGTLAGDTLWVENGVKHYASKVAKHKGHLIGMCGEDVPALDDVLDWLGDADVKKEEFKKVDFQLLVVTPEGDMYSIDNRGLKHKIKQPFWAVGSGCHAALGAMEFGADAKQAVKVAIKYINYCGGKVVSRSL